MDKTTGFKGFVDRLKDLFFGPGDWDTREQNAADSEGRPGAQASGSTPGGAPGGASFADSGAIDFDSLESAFLKSYRAICEEIASHREYEREIAETIGARRGINKEFDPLEYQRRVEGTLRELGVIALACGDSRALRILLLVLSPPREQQKQVTKELRKRFFSTMLVAVAEECALPLPDLIKRQYEQLKYNDPGLGHATHEELLELFRESLVHLPVDREHVTTTGASGEGGAAAAGAALSGTAGSGGGRAGAAAPAPGANGSGGPGEGEPQESQELLSDEKLDTLLRGMVRAAGIRKEQEMQRLIAGKQGILLSGSLLLKLLLFVFVLSFRAPTVGLFASFGPLSETILPAAIPDILLFLLLIGTIFDTGRLSRYRGRRRMIRIGVATVVRALSLDRGRVETSIARIFKAEERAVRSFVGSFR